ncbi:TetR/AcrR family transcriptional regulator [Jongsikchunia kroppenstedtii]|uniref:TetR/AcrR family transcriptional regulator n=1 Tax=Jongsikchunia kroppenstedtii TaxID=1121721 RepID=UPI000362173F|nr:TetR/AcrR family transcriptional regulator [Jongsikchunia kroppenstedtii]
MSQARRYAGRDVDERRRDRRARFLDAALELFGTDGYASTSVAAVCKTAGLSSRQFYAEFSDREHLLRELYDQLQDQAQTAVAEAFAASVGNGDLNVWIDSAVRAFVDVYQHDSRLVRVSFVEVVGVSPEFEIHRHAQRARWADLLAAAVESGQTHGLSVTAASPLAWAAYIGAVNAVLVLAVTDDTITIDAVIDTMRLLLAPGILGIPPAE